jgi:hypothetical protein
LGLIQTALSVGAQDPGFIEMFSKQPALDYQEGSTFPGGFQQVLDRVESGTLRKPFNTEIGSEGKRQQEDYGELQAVEEGTRDNALKDHSFQEDRGVLKSSSKLKEEGEGRVKPFHGAGKNKSKKINSLEDILSASVLLKDASNPATDLPAELTGQDLSDMLLKRGEFALKSKEMSRELSSEQQKKIGKGSGDILNQQIGFTGVARLGLSLSKEDGAGAGGEKAGSRGKLAGKVTAGKGGKKEKNRLTVVDLRTEKNAASSNLKSNARTGNLNVESEGNTHEFNKEVGPRGDVRLIQFEISGTDSPKDIPLVPTRADGAGLLHELRGKMNGEIVKQSSIILKDQDSGEIRLILKPERLGTVRIRIHLQDNHIAGRIIVDNNTVREVFERNLADLERSFREQGFSTGGLDVSVGSNGGGKRDNENLRTVKAIEQLEEQIPLLMAADQDFRLINLVV